MHENRSKRIRKISSINKSPEVTEVLHCFILTLSVPRAPLFCKGLQRYNSPAD